MDNGFNDQYGDKMSILDAKFLDIMNKETTINVSGHYEMLLPFPAEDRRLPNNKQLAEKRLQSLKNTMAKNKDYSEEYVGFMNEII